ncbi:LPS export ABC transporter ATP-binding protein [Candidatus Uabimicrobium sp. HlEnr_7]|uniref:LPS export ABC transporter ATP-binding protein n=1 Tax=Candidatus Uabimicrobium helgolandensis TaxID=3095367 RepID=UPI003556885F
MERFLQTVELVKAYKKRRVVDKVSLRIEPGKVIGLLGANGAGKSTTFRMVAGLVKPDHGRIVLDNKDISNLPMYMRARIGIGYLPQEATIFRRLTVRDNILVVLQHLKLSSKERKNLLASLLDEMNLKHLEKTYAERLSGGERRRLEVTRLLATSPSFMMWDEPFAAVDPIIVEYLQKIILDLKEKGIGILITDHKPKETLAISDYVYVMHQGKILVEDTPDIVAASPIVRDVYLGESVSVDSQKINKEDALKNAFSFFNNKKYEQTIDYLTTAFGNDIHNEARFLRGKCFLATEEYSSAIFDFKKVLKFSPEHKEAALCLQQAKNSLE